MDLRQDPDAMAHSMLPLYNRNRWTNYNPLLWATSRAVCTLVLLTICGRLHGKWTYADRYIRYFGIFLATFGAQANVPGTCTGQDYEPCNYHCGILRRLKSLRI
jgi:hypothetical protein